MHDIKFIRENPSEFDSQLARRGLPAMSAQILELDAAKRNTQTALQDLQARKNAIAKEIGKVKSQGGDASQLFKEAEEIKAKLAEAESGTDEVEQLLATIPNLMQVNVPDGKDETQNKVIRSWGEPKKFDFEPKAHFDIAEKLGWLDFDQAGKISGTRFAIYKGELARLERKLADFMIDVHTKEFGYTEYRTPHLVKSGALYGTGNLPKFGEDLFKTTGDHWLIPTSEVTLTNMVADKIVDEKELPMRMTAFTHCFRSEAGSAGKDTRGMIRMHEFTKVEMVSITTPETSEAEHERMLGQAELILQRLGLPYRVVLLCTGDSGFSATKTYDLEVWLPSQNCYREISSVSNCGAFQARRMKARYKKDGKTEFLHTLNGSGLAISRTMVALIENYQTASGGVDFPKI